MKLYQDPVSTTSRPVLMFLEEHDLPVERILVRILEGEQHTDAFRAINPNAAVPVLVDEDLVLPESSAILKYLADVARSPAYPVEPKARARINAAMDWFNTGFIKSLNYDYVYPALFPSLAFESPVVQGDVSTRGLEQGRRWLGVLNDQMLGPDRSFLFGDAISIADYLGAAHVALGEGIGFDYAPWPNVCRWLERLKARPSWDAVYAPFYGLVAQLRASAA